MGRQVPAVGRALDILELFLTDEELGQPEIVTRLGMPRSSVHEMVSTLLERDYLVRSSTDTRRVRLGSRTFELGNRYAERIDLAREGQDVARQTSERCEETVQVMILDDANVLYVAKCDSKHSVRLVSAVGRRLPAHCTAGGKVLLASLPLQEIDTMFGTRDALPRMTTNTITNLDDLRNELSAIRASGIGWEYCESNEAAACVAAPVRDHDGKVVAAMSISVPTARWSDQIKTSLADSIRNGAAELSRRLGYSGAKI